MNLKGETDKELVVLLTQDNEAAFSELYVRYKDRIYSFCHYLLKSQEETNDIVQEVFIRLWESRCFIDTELSFSSYLYIIARNRILNYFRNMDIDTKAKQILVNERQEEVTSIESDIIYTEYQKVLQEAIEQLSPQRKKIFNMSRIDNLSHKEIAAKLNISVYTVQEHISEALKSIKNYVNKHADISLVIFMFLFL